MTDRYTTTPTGMVREDKRHKPAFLDYFTPAVLRRYGEHMRRAADGAPFESDNWKKGGYSRKDYLDSLFRHFLTLWEELEGAPATDEDHAAAILFNIVGYMLEDEREKAKERAP